MTTPLVVRPIAWRTAAVASVVLETPRARTLILDVPDWPGHRAGQHVDVRLTAEDGYQAQRSYSIASAPEEPRLSLTVECLEDGEVSSYLCGELRTGDTFEIRGPIGGYFVWDITVGGPLMLIAGGSGIVPLVSMLRHRRAAADARSVRARLLYSSRRWDEVIYREELEAMAQDDPAVEVIHTLTRDSSSERQGYRRRIDRDMLVEVSWPPAEHPRIYVCGPTPLVESVAAAMVDLGHDPALVRTERFGPTGNPE